MSIPVMAPGELEARRASHVIRHAEKGSRLFCDECQWPWPCPVVRLIATIDAAKRENMCDACAGTGKPVSGLRCMCAGTGLMSVAAIHLRFKLTEFSTALEVSESVPQAEQRGEIRVLADLRDQLRLAETERQNRADMELNKGFQLGLRQSAAELAANKRIFDRQTARLVQQQETIAHLTEKVRGLEQALDESHARKCREAGGQK